jgi:outer membrane protein assembly factor BamA
VVAASAQPRQIVQDALSTRVGRHSLDAWERWAYEALREEGWLWAEVAASANGDTLFVEPRTRAHWGHLAVRGADSLQTRRFLEAVDVREGEVYRPGRWELRASRGLRRLADRGHPFVNVSVSRIHSDPATGRVDVEAWLAPGTAVQIAAVRIEGARHTRPEVLRRLAGIPLDAPYRESDLDEYRKRLLSRDIVSEVEDIAPEPYGQGPGEVELRVRLRQPESTGRVAAALGLVKDAQTNETRVSGSVDLALLDLFGTARQFSGRWSDDGRTRRRLDLAYVEPLLFGTPLDLRAELGQRHEDEQYDMVLGNLGLRLPWEGDRSLGLQLGIDRTTFADEEGRTRTRRRAGAQVGLRGDRPAGAGLYGGFDTRLEGARVSETQVDSTGISSSETTTQTILDAEVRLAWAFSRLLALESRATWKSVAASQLPLPLSEQWYVGGATTVRGYDEGQFHGEETAYGGLDFAIGPPRRGQAYAFVDLGWVKETLFVDERRTSQEHFLHGFGLGLRSPLAIGFIDLSLGFAEELSFDAGKLHIALVQEF